MVSKLIQLFVQESTERVRFKQPMKIMSTIITRRNIFVLITLMKDTKTHNQLHVALKIKIIIKIYWEEVLCNYGNHGTQCLVLIFTN
jgi:hypothetical protein